MTPISAKTYRTDTKTIPLAVPDLSGNEERYVLEAMRSTWISSAGQFIRRFEADFAAICGAKSAIGVSNGTSALHLALIGLDVRSNDEVLVPALTYISAANAVRYVGGEPIFVDSDPDTWCVNPSLLKRAITKKTKGIIAVHLYGHPADMDAINDVASKHGLWVIEDAAEAHCARYKDRAIGNLADMAAFSFYGNKIFTSGEGGALTLNDTAMEAKLRMLRGQGMDPHRHYYFPVMGHNFRLTNIACAILCAQLERRDEIIARREHVFKAYRQKLDGISGIGFQPVASWAKQAPWLFSITVDSRRYGRPRDELMAILARKGVETRPFFIPMHLLPQFKNSPFIKAAKLSEAEKVARIGMNLPTYSGLKDEDIGTIASIIRKARR